MGKHPESEPRPPFVEISYGTLFSVLVDGIETDRIDCVTDIGEDGYFYAGMIYPSSFGRPKIVHLGTAGPENFGRIVGHLSEEAVIEAFREGARDGWVFSEYMKSLERASARKGSRILMLSE